MCSDLYIDKTKCALKYGLKDNCKIFCEVCRIISIMEVAVFRIETFLKKYFTKYIFLEIFELFNIYNIYDSVNLDCQMWF